MQLDNENSTTKRIFIGNIPNDVTETALKKEFSAYGEVEKVELKTKGFGEAQAKFAFVNLSQTSDQLINKCLKKFANQSFHGEYLKVEVARESFLQRLKRELQEKETTKKVEICTDNTDTDKTGTTPKIAKITKFREASSTSSSNDDSSSSDSDSNEVSKRSEAVDATLKDDTLFIAKKNARASLQNGKIKIISASAEPIHIITKHTTTPKQLEGTAQKSDQKRKKSLNKLKDQYNKQKETIQQALTNIDNMKSRKITFDDDEIPTNSFPEIETKKPKLFDDDDSNDNNDEDYSKDFQVKEQFQGAKGEKLMKLQSKFKSDPRFSIDARFVEDEDGGNQEKNKFEENIVNVEANDEERKWQLGIIEQVVGRKLNSEPSVARKAIKNSMTRFDPNKEEHKRFVKSVERKTLDSDQQENTENNIFHERLDQVEVSKDQFYKVSDDFSKALNTKTTGFSLLSMFGRDEDDSVSKNKIQKYAEISLTKQQQTSTIVTSNPFKYDSSDSEGGDEGETLKTVTPEAKSSKKPIKSNGVQTTKFPIENFFIFSSDKRLEEGAIFFKPPDVDPNVDYEDVKRNLRNIINRKIAKKRKNTEGFQTVKSKFKKSRKS